MLQLELVYGMLLLNGLKQEHCLTWHRLPPSQVGMIVDRGHDFPISIERKLLEYGREMWLFRDQPHHSTTRAKNSYKGEHRGHAFICFSIISLIHL